MIGSKDDNMTADAILCALGYSRGQAIPRIFRFPSPPSTSLAHPPTEHEAISGSSGHYNVLVTSCSTSLSLLVERSTSFAGLLITIRLNKSSVVDKM